MECSASDHAPPPHHFVYTPSYVCHICHTSLHLSSTQVTTYTTLIRLFTCHHHRSQRTVTLQHLFLRLNHLRYLTALASPSQQPLHSLISPVTQSTQVHFHATNPDPQSYSHRRNATTACCVLSTSTRSLYFTRTTLSQSRSLPT